jgi:hypothetical protein
MWEHMYDDMNIINKMWTGKLVWWYEHITKKFGEIVVDDINKSSRSEKEMWYKYMNTWSKGCGKIRDYLNKSSRSMARRFLDAVCRVPRALLGSWSSAPWALWPHWPSKLQGVSARSRTPRPMPAAWSVSWCRELFRCGTVSWNGRQSLLPCLVLR